MEVTIYTRKEWRDFLRKNHKKENKIGMISYKKHTGKESISHRIAMEEAICFGWIDTTLKKFDDDRYIRYFMKRTKNSRWSKNTLSYAKDLIKRKLMTKDGLIAYQKGLKKPTIDHNFPRDPEIPKELEKELKKIKKLEFFKKLSPSNKRLHIYSILRAKKEETKQKRIRDIINLIR